MFYTFLSSQGKKLSIPILLKSIKSVYIQVKIIIHAYLRHYNALRSCKILISPKTSISLSIFLILNIHFNDMQYFILGVKKFLWDNWVVEVIYVATQFQNTFRNFFFKFVKSVGYDFVIMNYIFEH